MDASEIAFGVGIACGLVLTWRWQFVQAMAGTLVVAFTLGVVVFSSHEPADKPEPVAVPLRPSPLIFSCDTPHPRLVNGILVGCRVVKCPQLQCVKGAR